MDEKTLLELIENRITSSLGSLINRVTELEATVNTLVAELKTITSAGNTASEPTIK